MPRIREYKLVSPKGHTLGSTFIPTSDLREWLEPKLLELGKSLTPDNTQIPETGTRRWNGAISEVAHAASNRLHGQSFNTIFRRLTGILADETDTTDLGIADAIILSCNTLLSQTNLPVFPASAAAAKEMVECYSDYSDNPLTKEEQKILARQLERFTVGFLNGPRIFGDPASKKRDTKRTQDRKTRAKREYRNGSRPSPRFARNSGGGVTRVPRRVT